MIDLSQPLTRRQAARLLGGTSLALIVGGALAATPASAGRAWCRVDPVVKINGENGHVWVAAPDVMKKAATGPIELLIEVPVGATVSASPGNNGFGFGWTISWAESADLVATKRDLPVRISVCCPATDSSIPVEVGMEPAGGGPLDRGSARGNANQRYVTALCLSDAPGNSGG